MTVIGADAVERAAAMGASVVTESRDDGFVLAVEA